MPDDFHNCYNRKQLNQQLVFFSIAKKTCPCSKSFKENIFNSVRDDSGISKSLSTSHKYCVSKFMLFEVLDSFKIIFC